MSSALLSPIRLRNGIVARNRVWLAPLTNGQSAVDGVCSPEEQRWLERRAEGGFGAIETCAAHVSEDGKGFDGQMGVWGEHQLPRLRELAAGIARAGALGLVQLYHGGVRSPSRLTGQQPWSASSFTEDRPEFEVPRAADERDIEATISAFEQAAVRAAAAGFQGVELHGAHGYLLAQFLSSAMNQRTDDWGGPFVHRARLIRTIARRVRAATPAGFVLGVRISPENFGYSRGIDLDESLQLAAWLAEDGVDFLHVSLWDVFKNTAKRPDQHPIPLFRAALPAEVPLVVAGNIWTVADAEATLARGADVVALGKAAILNPDWPRRAADPAFVPERGPLTPAQLHDLAISDPFVTYLRRFKNLVRDA
ncbi:NADH:flavin oxidoreductase [Nannocystis radixulma]|uniref:NADH:flavin oxidoreductase n=1 Tax=Nannocystis radixulma TaxID=2995305 RepID=A0ABT5B5E9_9BACT|nr:NADH:flavin oxidoreductase [Nannocystis radixulma]MDC0669317.1 NADH:flavin oxidoreductase [Nannocystis radixulma]